MLAGALLLFALYLAVPRRVDLRAFDATSLARQETVLWRHYYEGHHLRLAAALYTLHRRDYGFSPWDSMRLAANAALAAKAFQPTRSRAEAQRAIPPLNRYFALMGRRAVLGAATEDLARWELEWWQLRREGIPPAVYGDAIARVEAALYGVPEGAVRSAGQERAEAMALRDRLGPGGLQVADWTQIEERLTRSYRLLREAVGGGEPFPDGRGQP